MPPRCVSTVDLVEHRVDLQLVVALMASKPVVQSSAVRDQSLAQSNSVRRRNPGSTISRELTSGE